MNTHKGIVFETTTAYSIFLTSDGLFEKGIPLTSSVQIGEEVYFRPYPNMKQKVKDSFKSRWTTPILSVVATIVLLFSVLLPAQSNVSAYVQIDINPSIELGINKAGNVYSFKGLNDEGVGIKRDISFWKGKPLSWVLLQIVDRTESLIEETEVVEITTIYQNKMDHETLEKVIETAVATSASQVLPKKQAIKVTEATVSDWESATNKGVSVQKYQSELKKKNKDKLEKVKDKVKGKMKSETKNKETQKKLDNSKVIQKKQDNSKVIKKDVKEKKEPKNEKKNPHKKSLKTDKPNNKDVQKKQKVNQNKVKNEQPKEKQKANNKKEQLKAKKKSEKLANKQSNLTNTKDSNSHIVKKDNKVNGNKKVKKEIKKGKITHKKRSNAKEKNQKDDKPKHEMK